MQVPFVDLHCHLLPGVDDGARDLDEAVAYAERIARLGVTELTVTPHVHPVWLTDPLEIGPRAAALQAALDSAGVGVTVHPGGELHHSALPGLTTAGLDAIAHGPAGARWVLMEAPFAGIDDDFVNAGHDLMDRGYGVLIAHPERAAGLRRDGGLTRLGGLVARGARFQVNVDSLLGRHGPGPEVTGEWLLRRGLAHCLASDAHPGTREHTLADGVALVIAAGGTPEQAQILLARHPAALLRDGLPRVAGRLAG